MNGLSFARLLALLRKEWIQVRRDAMTLRIIIAIPIMQLFLFGYAINSDPKNLPTGLLSSDHSKYERTIVAGLKNSGYYDVRPLASEAEAEAGLARGDLMFVIALPPGFDRAVDRGESPSILIDAAARVLRQKNGVEAAAVFGQALHVAGTDRAALTEAIHAIDGDLKWQEVAPRLEDVFIHMLSAKGGAP